jgi:putative ABC transport system ATP-binding protein
MINSTGANLVLHDVFKIYNQGEVQTVALRGANLEVQGGEFVAVVGRSGAGKSTLFGLIAGLIEPTAGRIEFDTKDLGNLSEAERSKLRRNRIGVTFQQGNLVPFLSALENVELPLAMAGQPNTRASAEATLREVGLESRLNHRASQLSGGEQARVGLAIALSNNPALLLADEPTGELDTATGEQIMRLLERLNRERKMTVLVVTHNLEVAARAGRRVQISDGVLTEQEMVA